MTRDNARYDRQMILPEIGDTGQARISNARVLVIGAGGLGCPALQYLAGAGVGHIGICDGDRVEEHNLHRQILFNMGDIGKNKAEAAAHKCENLNPYIDVTPYAEMLTPANAREIISGYNIIIDGSDNFETKFMVNDVCVRLEKPFIYGAVLGFKGQIALFNASPNSANLRWLFPAPPSQNIPNCAENGVLGAVSGTVGTLQAVECLKFIIKNDTLAITDNSFTTIDLKTLNVTTNIIPRPLDQGFVQKEERLRMNTVQKITVADVQAKISNGNDFYLIDVREQEEWDRGHIKNAEFFPMSNFLENGATPPWGVNEDIVLYCRSGKRSQHVAEVLVAQGYKNVSNMMGGILAWDDASLQNCA